jgi:hypothetical protein
MESTETKTFDIKTLKGAGAPERHDFSNQKPKEAATDNGNSAAAAAASDTETPEAKLAREQAEAAAKEIKLPELSDEQLKKLFADKGIEGFESFEKLKEKISKVDAPVDNPPTEEEKKAAEAAMEKRMADHFVATGGSLEGFVALKQIAAMDLKELSVAEIKREMKEAKFTDAEIDVVLKERYYQLNPEELQKIKTVDEDGNEIEETDEDFQKRKDLLAKKVSYGSTKLEKRSTHTKQNAETILNNLREAIKAEDSKKVQENQILSKVDEISKTLPRKITFELGKVNDTEIAPVVYDVTEADITEIAAEFKDSTTRQQILLNEDKTLNLTGLMEMKLRNKILTSALKAAYIEGGNRQVAAFEKVFPGSAKSLGVGGSQAASTQGRKGVIASAGQPEVARPTT